MGRLSDFSCREVIRKLKKLGFEFYRSGKGDHEIRLTPFTRMKTTITPSQTDSRKHSPKYSQMMPS
ncbi:MAG: type II toxin-antitoxin system HicA family toxin [Cyanobacteria bacterium P01_H01_bin.15]